jgi:hypothetical protein
LVAQDEYAWLYELDHFGYTREDIAELLIEEVIDAPWIVFEKEDVEETAIQTEYHQLLCVHNGGQHRSLPPTLISAGPEEDSSNNSPASAAIPNQERISRLIQELCGLAGVAPNSSNREEWNGHVSFDNQQLIASITLAIPGTPASEHIQVLSRISKILDGVCNALAHVQGAGLMCERFGILCVVPKESPSTDPDYVELCRVDLVAIVHLRKKLTRMLEQPKSTAAMRGVDGISRHILSPLGFAASSNDVSDVGEVIQICSLAVQFLSLGFLSYSRAYSGAIQPFFLDCPLQHILLLGSLTDTTSIHIDVRLQELTCMGDMIQNSMIVFHMVDENTTVSRLGRYDLLASPEDIMDTWGPGQFVRAPDGDGNLQIYAISIGGGTITANAEKKGPLVTGH